MGHSRLPLGWADARFPPWGMVIRGWGLRREFGPSQKYLEKKADSPLSRDGQVPIRLGMRLNSFSCVVRQRLASLGLAQLPPEAVAYIEGQMLQEVAKLAAHKITPRYVASALLKALAPGKPAPDSTRDTAPKS